MISSMQSTFNKGNNVMFIIQKKITEEGGYNETPVDFDENNIITEKDSIKDGTSTGTRRTIRLKDTSNQG
jgi:hypothetical protein